MTNEVSYKGSGLNAITNDNIGIGQGLQVGETEINFSKGTVQLMGSQAQSTLIGKFRGFLTKTQENARVKSIAFRSKTPCTLYIGDAQIDYTLSYEYLVINHVDVESMKVSRPSTGLAIDYFDWGFIASDDPEFRIEIIKTSLDSQGSTIFSTALRTNGGSNPYVQNINLQGAKKFLLIGQSANLGEAGTAVITIEIFDIASNSWVKLVDPVDIFTLAANQTKIAELGETAGRIPNSDKSFIAYNDSVGGIQFVTVTSLLGNNIGDTKPIAGFVSNFGHYFPSGDNILRVKATMTGQLTFSLGIIKVVE